MKVALAQIDTTVADFAGNLDLVLAACARARAEGADLVVFPEQTLPGYPAEDFLERADFVAECERAVEAIAADSRGSPLAIVVGALTATGLESGKRVYNSAVVIRDGAVLGRQHKTLLPTYDVFDEGRYFEPAREHSIFEIAGRRVGVAICEDIWNDPAFWSHRLYAVDPLQRLRAAGAELLVVISASPFSIGRRLFRYHMLESILAGWPVPVVFVNLVGGNTTLVFDGNSFAMDARAQLLAQAPAFREDFRIVDIDQPRTLVKEATDECAEAHDALVLGTRDYVVKSGFSQVVIGLSGGIDSALTAVIAAAAVGPTNVIGISMPTRYSSEGSLTDSRLLAERLGIVYHEISIEEIFTTILRTLAPIFAGRPEDVTEENIQARARGLVLMAVSNKLGALLLTTGNKSELAVGYCTLYGDMCGGLAVISDVPKTLVYRLARYINRSGEIIPRSVLEKPPSAELRPDQKDQDTLPPYDLLDRIIEAFVEQGVPADRILKSEASQSLVADICGKIHRSEYKRKQAAPGLRITHKAFGPGRRFPIVHRYRRIGGEAKG